MEMESQEPFAIVDLNKEEMAELDKPINGSGGYQSLFKRLKRHVDEKQEILTLTPDLATTIVRYSSGQYGQGGFQERLTKGLARIVAAAIQMEETGDYIPDQTEYIEENLPAGPETMVEDNLGEDGETTEPIRYAITSYGADYTADKLVERLDRGDIKIPPFQRGFVWRHNKASRFIESLLLGLPVPGVFLSRETESKRLLVIDGQQRLLTLLYFYRGEFGMSKRVFALKGVDSRFDGLTYATLPDEDRRQLDDSIIHATVIRQDEPSDDQSCVYHIFERLNTGGTLLRPQEIRACIFHGKFNELLSELNDNVAWRKVFGQPHSRMRDRELILRFLALHFSKDDYKSPMKSFLNKFMGRNRDFERWGAAEMQSAFIPTIELVHQAVGNDVFKRVRVLNAAVFDAVMVGLARRLAHGIVTEPDQVREAYLTLLGMNDFLAASQFSTADETNVSQRIGLATTAFSGVK